MFANSTLSINALAKHEGRCRTRLAKLVELSCLAPELVKQIVEGRQSPKITTAALMSEPLPLEWEVQVKRFAGLLGLG